MGYLERYILILCYYYQCFLTVHSKEIIMTSVQEDLELDAYLVPNYEKKLLQMNISWSNNFVDVHGISVSSSESQLDKCSEIMCDTIKYGISKDIKSILLPETPKIHTQSDPECHFLPGCNYIIELLNFDNNIVTNKSIYIPECILGECNCRSNLMLNIQENVINLDTIKLMLSIQFENNFKINTTIQKQLYLRITKTNSTLPWGEMIPNKIKIIAEDTILLNITSSLISPQYIFKDMIKIKTNSLLVPGSPYFMYIVLLDEYNNCIDIEKKFNFLVPQSIVEFNTEFIIYIVILITICILVLISFPLFRSKFIKKNKAITIPLHENILYSHADQRRLLGVLKTNDHELPVNNIKRGKLIKGGEFGEVYEAEIINLDRFPNKMKVAIKTLRIANGMFFYEQKEDLLEEINTMKKIGTHDNIVGFIGCCTLQEPFMLVMEYVGGGDLKDYLTKVRHNVSLSTCSSSFYKTSQNKFPRGRYLDLSLASIDSDKISRAERPSLTETTYTILSDIETTSNYNSNNRLDYKIDVMELQSFGYQIANGMAYLEKLGITHRDLAARNILIGEGKRLKITDFGLSRDGIYVRRIGKLIPFRWCSIEALHDNLYSSKSDVWAFGVVLWEIGTLGSHPYAGIQNISEILSFFKNGNRLEKPGICSDELYNLMLDCWLENYNQRPTFEEVLKALKTETKSSYIDLRYLSSDYVFPPTQAELEGRHK